MRKHGLGGAPQVCIGVRVEQPPQQKTADLALAHQRPDVVQLAREAQELDQAGEGALLLAGPVRNCDRQAEAPQRGPGHATLPRRGTKGVDLRTSFLERTLPGQQHDAGARQRFHAPPGLTLQIEQRRRIAGQPPVDPDLPALVGAPDPDQVLDQKCRHVTLQASAQTPHVGFRASQELDDGPTVVLVERQFRAHGDRHRVDRVPG